MSDAEVIEVKFPFHVVMDVLTTDDGLGEQSQRWKPGCRWEIAGPYGEGSEGTADGEGKMILTVVSRHRPPGYQERVFYTRQWQDPDGNTFGIKKLRVMGSAGFKAMCKGYRYPYGVV